MISGGLEDVCLKYYGMYDHKIILNGLLTSDVVSYHMFLDKDYNKWLFPLDVNNKQSFMFYTVYKFNCVRFVDFIAQKKVQSWSVTPPLNNIAATIQNFYIKTKNLCNKTIRYMLSYNEMETIGQGVIETEAQQALYNFYTKHFSYVDSGYSNYLVINKTLVKRFYKVSKDIEVLISFISEDIIKVMNLVWPNIMQNKNQQFFIKDVASLNCGPLYTSEPVLSNVPDNIKNQIKDVIMRQIN